MDYNRWWFNLNNMEVIYIIEYGGYASKKYVVCHNDVDVYHVSELDIGQYIATGQPYCELFNTEEAMLEVFENIILGE